MAKHREAPSATRDHVSHFDDGLTSKIISVLADLDDSRPDDPGGQQIRNANSNNGSNGERRPADPECNAAFGGWMTDGGARLQYQIRPSSRTDPPPAKRSHADATSDAVNYVTSNIQNARTYRHHGRAADVDYTSVGVCKACVEPKTYRYIPNNGRYRSSKALLQILAAQKPPARKPADAKALTPEQKRLQRELQRQLRLEFELDQDKTQAEERERNRPFGSLLVTGSPGHRGAAQQETTAAPDEGSAGTTVKDEARGQERVGSPLTLPPINVPLVKTDGARSQAIDISRIANQLTVFREDADKNGIDFRRTRRGLHLGMRSRSEPPPALSRGHSGESPVSLEVVPTVLLPGARVRASSGRQPPPPPPPSDPDVRQSGRPTDGWTDAGSDQLAAVSEGSEVADTGRRRGVGVDGTPTQLAHIRYMAASGELSTAPAGGKPPTAASPDRAGSDVGASKRQTEARAEPEHGRTKYMAPMSVRHAAAKDAPSHARKSRAAKDNHLLSDLNPNRLVGGGNYRAVPVGQVRISEKPRDQSPANELDILPKISGRKVTMAVTSHRIV